jgi:tetratricopeptide (TPR) repeat protein/uncharacterized caspase-like protein
MQRSVLLLVTLLVLCAVQPPHSPAAPRSARPTAAVQTLLDRAAGQSTDAALQTLDTAARRAESGSDRAGALAVAALAAKKGDAGYEQGDVKTAQAFYERALSLREKYAPNSLELASSLSNLGTTYRVLGNPVKAQELHARALALWEKLAPGSLELAAILTNLGTTAYDRGELAKARGLHERALAIFEKRAPESLDLARILNNLALTIYHQGDLAKARALHERVLALREKLAPGSLDLASSFHNLALVASAEGDLARARTLDERALALVQEKAPNSVYHAVTLNSLGVTTRVQGDLVQSRDYYRRALAIWEKLGPASLNVATTLRNMGALAQAADEPAQARALYERALAIQQELAPSSLDMAVTLNNIATLAKEEGELPKARELHERARAIQEKQAPGSLDLALTLLNLSGLALVAGDLAQAQEMSTRALAIQEKKAPASLAVAAGLGRMAAVINERGDARAAIEPLRRALQIVEERAPGSEMAPTLLRNLARLLQETGDTAAAAGYLKRAEAIEEQTRSLPRDPAPDDVRPIRIVRPQIRFLAPAAEAVVQGEEVSVSLALVAPVPLARLRVWINGRPFGDASGFALADLTDKGGLIRDKGGLIRDKGGLIRDKELALTSAEVRAGAARELPEEVAGLVKQLPFAQLEQLRLTLPVEDTDGEFLRIAVAADSSGGSHSDRRILPLRRPEAEARRGVLRVLAIGIGAYASAPRLRFAAADARDLAAALQAQAGEGGVGAPGAAPPRLYREAKVKLLTDGDATLPAIREALDGFTRDVQPGETLVLALSGHGVREGDAFYFAPVGLDPNAIAKTGLPWKEVLARLEQARRTARAVWVLADCCRAAPELGRAQRATGQDLRRGIEDGGNLVICTASSGDTPSYESEDLQHGLFTQAWLEALRGDVPGAEILYQETARGRVLTLSGLQFVVDARVAQHARRAGVRQRVEFPRLEGSFAPGQPIFVPVARDGEF